MPVTAKFSEAFYAKLGHGVADELVDWFNKVDATYRSDLRELNELNFQRFDAKLEQRFAEADAKLEQRFAEAGTKLERRLTQFEARLDRRITEQMSGGNGGSVSCAPRSRPRKPTSSSGCSDSGLRRPWE